MKFIGITGGVGAGKTEILKYLAGREDTKVMLADDIARELSEPDSPVTKNCGAVCGNRCF